MEIRLEQHQSTKYFYLSTTITDIIGNEVSHSNNQININISNLEVIVTLYNSNYTIFISLFLVDAYKSC